MATAVPPVTLAWAAFAVSGAGLVNIALGAEHWDRSVTWGAGLTAVGLAQLGWALLSLAAARPLAARGAIGALLLTTAGWAVVVAQGLVPTGGGPGTTGSTVPAPLTAADVAVVVLGLVGAGTVALLDRTRRTASAVPQVRPTRPHRSAGTGRALAGWAVGAAFAAAVATPGLAATEAGAAAVPHGTTGTHSPVEPPTAPLEPVQPAPAPLPPAPASGGHAQDGGH